MSYFCYQGNDNDCGFASLKMLMAYYAHNKSYLYISKPNKKERYTFKDLIEIASKYSFQLNAYSIINKDIRSLEAPFLALLNNNHLVMVKSVKKGIVVVYDPGVGVIKKDLVEFVESWSGKCLEREPNSLPMKLSIKPPVIMPKINNLIQLGFVLVIAATLLTGFYFIKEDSNFIIVIGFLMFFVICELVENWYLIKNIKYFDNKYIPKFFDNEKYRTKESYKDYIEFKQNYFKSKKTILASLLIVITISVLLSINDPKNILAITVILLAKTIDKLIFKPNQNKKEAEIDEIEQIAFNNKDETINNLLKANKLAGQYGLFVSARKVIFTFLIAVLSILMMCFNHIVSTNYIVFYFGAYYVISTTLDSGFDYVLSYSKSKKLLARFIDRCNL